MDKEKKEKIALFRFGVISRLLWVKEDERQQEALLREITSTAWEIPFSNRTALGRSTVLEWLKKYRDSGGRIESLESQQRSDKGKARSLDEETEQVLVGLKTELKGASLPVILRVARERKLLPPDFHASIQSLYRLFQRRGLNEPQGLKPDLRRYETELPNDLWQSDCMHGPSVIVDGKVRKSFLFAFLDDHSRLIPHGEFYLQENLKNLTDCLIKALSKRGLPRKIYLDNGPSFRSHQLAHATASLGISLIHCTPYRPEGKGKIERYFKTLRMQFLPLLPPSLSLSTLNERFEQWCDQTYHRTVHGTTKETPWDRYTHHLHLLRSAPKNLSDFFRTRARRKVDRDRTVTLHGRIYEAPVELIEKNVTLLYHEEDPQRIEIFYQDQSYGFLVSLNPHINARIKRNAERTHLEPQRSFLLDLRLQHSIRVESSLKGGRTMTRYKHFFGFQREPFPQDIKVQDLYPLPGLKALSDRFLYALELGAISVITGEVGTGKSTSLRYASSPLHPSLYRIIPVTANTGTILELLKQILLSLQVESRSITLLTQTLRGLLSEITAKKQQPVLIIDEAHLMRIELFAQLHTLVQFDFDSKPLVPLILCGQNTLIDKLIYHTSRPLASRVVGRSHLEGLTLKEMEGYLNHHLKIAGVKDPLFAEEAILAIQQGSGGLLRRANHLARGSLVAAALEKNRTVSAEHVRAASTEII